MTGSGLQLGVLLLLAVLLQTVVVTITVLHFSTALGSVSSLRGFGSADAWTHRARDPSEYLTDYGWVGGGGRIMKRVVSFKTSKMHRVTFISSLSLQGSNTLFIMGCNYPAAFRVRVPGLGSPGSGPAGANAQPRRAEKEM